MTQFESRNQPGVMLNLALMQLLCAVVFSAALYYFFDKREALSALFGGLIPTLTSLFMAGRLKTAPEELPAPAMLIRFYITVVLKAVFTLAMMAICIVFMKVSMLPFIIAFALGAVGVNILALLRPPAPETQQPDK